jgi:hypothetical protein
MLEGRLLSALLHHGLPAYLPAFPLTNFPAYFFSPVQVLGSVMVPVPHGLRVAGELAMSH